MKWDEVFCNTFKAMLQQVEPEIKKKVDFMLPSMPMVKACRADDFEFFQPAIDADRLTVGQMHHAAQRYLLGKSKSGLPIFWMIDDMVQPLDGRIGTDVWISGLLKAREPILESWQVKHCLFGLHLLDSQTTPVSIVESERSAVILSEIFPENIWLAVMEGAYFTIDLLKPLQGRKVMVFPDTDETMSNYICWLETCELARNCFHLDIECSDYLENTATAEQKHRQIDLLDLYLESY